MIYKNLIQIYINNMRLIIITIMLFSGCTYNKNHVDISGINVTLKVQRLDRDMFQIDSTNFNTQIAIIKKKYGDFFPFYCEQISLLGKPDTLQRFRDSLLSFLHDSYIKEVYDSAENKFGDFNKQKTDIETGLKYLKYYFPRTKTPTTLIIYIGGFSLGAFTYNDNVIALGLDMYLGNKLELYQRVSNLPQFVIRRLKPEYITPNAIRVTITGLFNFNSEGKKLIDNMIYNGKIMYAMDKILPDLPDTINTGYTEHQLAWCNYNEAEIWKYFIGENLLFNTNENDYITYVTDGPTTSGMPQESPGNLGSWVGWQIVKKYMERFPNTTLPQLMAITNSQQILDGSHYKP
jgi:hypothetical protein